MVQFLSQESQTEGCFGEMLTDSVWELLNL